MSEQENGNPNREFERPDDDLTGRPSGQSDPFGNLDELRLPQDFVAQAGVKRLPARIAVRKPDRQEFVRVRPGDEWQFETVCLTEVSTKDVYLVGPTVFEELRGDAKPTCLRMCISRDSKVPFFWPIPLPGPDGRWNRWHESAAAAADRAETNWLKVVSNMSTSTYLAHVAPATIPEPDWPDGLSMESLLRLAFKDRVIDSIDHPLLKRLRGEI